MMQISRFIELPKKYLVWVQDYSVFSYRCLKRLRKPPIYPYDVYDQMNHLGVASIFIVGLTGLFTGMVMSLQFVVNLDKFGISHAVGKTVSLSLIRELGPVLTGFVMAGRAGAGIASQISSMLVTEQIDALQAEGIDPLRRVVNPRLLACIFMLPVLTLIFDAIGLFGGGLVSHYSFGVSPAHYWAGVYDNLLPADVVMGVVKPIFFGLIIGLSGGFFGMNAVRDAQGVGEATTRTVVTSMILIIVLDFVLTKVLVLFVP